jgi:ABC-2 type transport system ATP-binding protein
MEYFACLKKSTNTKWDGEINSVLKMVNLTELKNEKCKNLSGGMIRRVGIAQALLGRPGLMLLDEPTAGLDPDERKSFSDIIRKLKGTMTIVLSTHIISDVKNACDKMLVLEKGVLVGVIDLEKNNDRDIEDLYFSALHGMVEK